MHLKTGLLIGISAISFGFCVSAFLSSSHFIDLSNRAQLAEQIANSADQVKDTLLDAETGTRGYVITGNEDYLQPYNAATQRIDSDLNALSVFVSRDPLEEHNVANIIDLAHQKMDILANVNRVRHDEGFPAAREVTFQFSGVGQGKRVMDDIRVLVMTIQVNEAFNSTNYLSESRAWGEAAILSVIGFAVSAICAMFLGLVIVKKPEFLDV